MVPAKLASWRMAIYPSIGKNKPGYGRVVHANSCLRLHVIGLYHMSSMLALVTRMLVSMYFPTSPVCSKFGLRTSCVSDANNEAQNCWTNCAWRREEQAQQLSSWHEKYTFVWKTIGVLNTCRGNAKQFYIYSFRLCT